MGTGDDEGKKGSIALTLTARERLLTEAERISNVGSWAWHVASKTVHWSDEMYRIFGREQAPGLDLFDAFVSGIHPEDRERIVAGQRTLIEVGSVEPTECRIVRPDGVERIVRLQAAAVLDADGRPVRFVGTVHDLTKMRQLEADLFQAQKLEALGRLAAGIAHDFNNILAVLQLGLEVQRRRGSPGPSGDDLDVAISRGAAMTRQLLAFGRKSVLEPRVLDAGQLAGEAVAMVERLLGDAVVVRLEIAPGPLVVLGDATQLQHVVINLLVNARDAMPTGGTVRLTVRAAELKAGAAGVTPAVAAGEYVEIEVRDEGTGIAPADVPHIFEPFFTTKPKGQGTGLGLASVFGTVVQSGGGMRVKTELGVGTTFSVYLPRSRESPQVDVIVPASAAAFHGGRVLVVDDHPTLGRAVLATLKDLGYDVTLVADARAVLADAAALAASTDVVVTDLDMPGATGLDVARALWTHAPGMPCLFVSGHSRPELPEGAKTLFLQKPFSGEELEASLAALLGR